MLAPVVLAAGLVSRRGAVYVTMGILEDWLSFPVTTLSPGASEIEFTRSPLGVNVELAPLVLLASVAALRQKR